MVKYACSFLGAMFNLLSPFTCWVTFGKTSIISNDIIIGVNTGPNPFFALKSKVRVCWLFGKQISAAANASPTYNINSRADINSYNNRHVNQTALQDIIRFRRNHTIRSTPTNGISLTEKWMPDSQKSSNICFSIPFIFHFHTKKVGLKRNSKHFKGDVHSVLWRVIWAAFRHFWSDWPKNWYRPISDHAETFTKDNQKIFY